MALKEIKSEVTFRGKKFNVFINDKGIVYYSDPNTPNTRNSSAQPDEHGVNSIEEANTLAIQMLEMRFKRRRI